MGDRIRRINAKQVEKILKKYGFELVSQKVIKNGAIRLEIFR